MTEPDKDIVAAMENQQQEVVGVVGVVEKKKGSSALTGVKDSIAGTIAGAACLFTGHPFDTIKVRMQTQASLTEGALSTLTRTVTQEGPLALYKGVTSPLVGMMFETAVLFVVYGQLKLLIQKDPNIPLTVPQLSLAGGASGAFTSLVLTPIELIKCRLQIQKGRVGEANADVKYKGSWDCFKTILRERGPQGLFKGLVPTMAREIPGNFAFFGVYEYLKRAQIPKGKTLDDLSLGSLILSGGMGGVAYWTLFYPADVAKSKIQTMGDSVSMGLVPCLKEIYRTEGWKGLYRGYTPTILRAFPANAVMFSVYELIARVLS